MAQSDLSAPTSSRRPPYVTVICLLYVLSFCVAVLAITLVYMRQDSLRNEEYALLRIAISLIPSLINLIAGVRLFQARRDAVLLWGAGLTLNAAATIRLLFTVNLTQAYSLGMQVSGAYVLGRVLASFGWVVTIPVY